MSGNNEGTEDKSAVKEVDPTDKKDPEVPDGPESVPAPDSTSIKDGGMYLNQSTGNTEINSLCKFNFIFYFIYKHKYEEEQTGNEFLDYEF